MKSLLDTKWCYNPAWSLEDDQNQGIWQDDRLTMKSKGLFGYMNTKPTTYDFACKRIATDMRDAIDSVKTAMKELESFGYLNRTKLGNGRVIHDLSGNAYVGIKPRIELSTLERCNVIMHVEDSLYPQPR